MSAEIYTFDAQKDIGEKWEHIICSHFSKLPNVRAWMPEELSDVDLYTQVGNQKPKTWDIKADDKAAKTGNVFIETLSDMNRQKWSWLFTSTADYIGYVDIHNRTLYYCSMRKLRKAFREKWACRHWLPVKNLSRRGESYIALGVIVPLVEFRSICTIMEIPNE